MLCLIDSSINTNLYQTDFLGIAKLQGALLTVASPNHPCSLRKCFPKLLILVCIKISIFLNTTVSVKYEKLMTFEKFKELRSLSPFSPYFCFYQLFFC